MLEGEPFPNHNVVLEFPTSEAVDAWYHSDGYQAAIPVRLRRPQPPSSQSFREGSA